MLKFLLIAVTLLLSQLSLADTDLARQIKVMKESEVQSAAIQTLAELAKAKDAAAIMTMVDESQKPPGSEELANRWLNTVVFPFFERFAKLHNYKQVTHAVLPDGRTGLWHYTFIVDDEGKVHPFRVALISTEQGPRLLAMIVNECVKDRHPFCP